MKEIGKNNKLADVQAEISALTEVVFLPNPSHRKTKTRFWSRWDDMLGDGTVTLATAMQVTGDARLKTWWNQPGFQEWFLNKDETRERLEYLYQIALDSAESVLLDPDANDNAKVQMVKVIAHLAGKEPAKQSGKDDFGLPDDPEKLRAYIKQHGQKLIGEVKDDNKKED